MRNSPRRSNSRKSRRARNRSKATRLSTQGMIDEYTRPVETEKPQLRHIPIRSRRHFVPTASVADGGSDAQLTFPLNVVAEAGLIEEGYSSEKATVRDQSVEPSRGARSTSGATSTGHFSQLGTVFKDVALSVEDSTSDKPFSMRRFLSGCAVGSAAAAFILMLVQSMMG